MKKVEILLVEDDAAQAQNLRAQLESSGYEVVNVADNLTDALGFYYSQQPDLVLVDIYLKGQPDGITFAERISANPSTLKPFIFLTQHADQETFASARGTAPYHYLLKPFNPVELQYAIALALEKFAQESAAMPLRRGGAMLLEEHFFIKQGQNLVKLEMKDISYVAVDGKYCKLVSSQGVYLVQRSLKQLLQKLDDQFFLRVHRNYVVNLDEVQKVAFKDDEISLRDGTSLPISQHFKREVMAKLDILK